jgi:hypothetical protein
MSTRITRSSATTSFAQLPDKPEQFRLNDPELNDKVRKAVIGFWGSLETAQKKGYISTDGQTVIKKGVEWYNKTPEDKLNEYVALYEKKLTSTPGARKASPAKEDSPQKEPTPQIEQSPPRQVQQPVVAETSFFTPQVSKFTRSSGISPISRDIVADPGPRGAAADKNAFFKDKLLDYLTPEEKLKFFKIWPKGIQGNQIFDTFKAILNDRSNVDNVENLTILNKLVPLVNNPTFKGQIKDPISIKTPRRLNQESRDLTVQEAQQVQNIRDATFELQQAIKSPTIEREDIAPMAQKVITLIENSPVASRTRSKTSGTLLDDTMWSKLKNSALGILQNIRQEPFVVSTPEQQDNLEESINWIDGMPPPQSVRTKIEQQMFGVPPGRGTAFINSPATPVLRNTNIPRMIETPSTATGTPSTATDVSQGQGLYTPSTATATPSTRNSSNTDLRFDEDDMDYVEIGIYLPDITNTTPGNQLRSFRLTGADLLWIAKYLKATV